MQIQRQNYYSISGDESNSTLIITKLKKKPLAAHSAYHTLHGLQKELSKQPLKINGIHKISDVEQIAIRVFEGYEQKMGSWGRFWDDIKQFICIQTERKQLKALRDEIIKQVPVQEFASSKNELFNIQKDLFSVHKGIEDQKVPIRMDDWQKSLPPLVGTGLKIQGMKIGDLETYFKMIGELAQHFNSLNLITSTFPPYGKLRDFQDTISDLQPLVLSLCAKMGQYYLKLDRLDQAYQAFKFLDDKSKITGYIALIDKYLEKNQTEEAYKLAETIAEFDLQEAEAPLIRILEQCERNNVASEIEIVKDKLRNVQFLLTTRGYDQDLGSE